MSNNFLKQNKETHNNYKYFAVDGLTKAPISYYSNVAGRSLYDFQNRWTFVRWPPPQVRLQGVQSVQSVQAGQASGLHPSSSRPDPAHSLNMY